MGSGVEAAPVLALEADLGNDVAAKTLTNAMRQRVLESKEFTLNGESPSLSATAGEAKCSLKRWGRPMVAANDRVFDAPCLRRIGEQVRTRHFFWGFVYVEGSTTFVRLHFWQESKGDRAVTLPYDSAQPTRLADRLYKKLVTPNAVGDLVLTGGPAGELFIDGKPAGAYADGVELTLETGEHALEVRDGSRELSRGRARIEPGGRSEARLTYVAPPAPLPPQPPSHDPKPTTVREKASAWPWVLGGVGVAGLVGAGVFWGLRAGVKGDLDDACAGRACPDSQEGATDQINLYRTLSAVSLGVGVAAGAGLAAYLLAPRRGPPPVSGAVVPLAGGAVAGVAGTF